MKLRTGLGYDVHQLAEGEDLWLEGILIPHHKGSVGHSDADVLIHAICDALLGAMNKRDIGYHFPDNDPQYKGVDSKYADFDGDCLCSFKGKSHDRKRELYGFEFHIQDHPSPSQFISIDIPWCLEILPGRI